MKVGLIAGSITFSSTLAREITHDSRIEHSNNVSLLFQIHGPPRFFKILFYTSHKDSRAQFLNEFYYHGWSTRPQSPWGILDPFKSAFAHNTGTYVCEYKWGPFRPTPLPNTTLQSHQLLFSQCRRHLSRILD